MQNEQVYVARFYSLKNSAIQHWGFLVIKPDGKEYIYHNIYDRVNNLGGNVVREDYNKFKNLGYFLFDKTPIPISEEQIKERSKSMLREKWDALRFNCRDYVKRIWSKIPEGQEKQFAWGIGIGLGLLTAGIIIGATIYNRNKKK